MASMTWGTVLATAVMLCMRVNTVSAYTGFEPMGCFKDLESNRILQYKTSFSSIYAQKCFEICQAESTEYTYFGLQWGIECWCGTDSNVEKNAPQLEDAACDYECATPSQMCGGYYKMNMFAITNIPGPNPRVGCFADTEERAMTATPLLSTDDMTISKCQEHCSAAGTLYYGLQWGRECWCGNEYDLHGEVEYVREGDVFLSSCDEWPCTGNTLEQCGGLWMLAVYVTAIDRM